MAIAQQQSRLSMHNLQVLYENIDRGFPMAYLCRSCFQKRGALIMTIYGYARVSTRDQDLIAQDAELMAAGCAKVF